MKYIIFMAFFVFVNISCKFERTEPQFIEGYYIKNSNNSNPPTSKELEGIYEIYRSGPENIKLAQKETKIVAVDSKKMYFTLLQQCLLNCPEISPLSNTQINIHFELSDNNIKILDQEVEVTPPPAPLIMLISKGKGVVNKDKNIIKFTDNSSFKNGEQIDFSYTLVRKK